MKFRQRPIAVAVSALVIVAAACGGDDGDAVTTAPTTEPAPAETSEPTTTDAPDTTEVPDTTDVAETTSPPDAPGPGCDATEGALVGYSQPLPDPNFALIEAVIDARLAEVGATLAPVNAQLDPGKQISDVQTLLQQGIDVLLINPVAAEAVQGVLGEVQAQGIPVVVQDTKFGGPYYSNVTADVESAAEQGARILKELVGDGKVAAIIGPPFAEVLVREAETFAAVAEEIGLNVVETQTNQTITPDGARALVDAWRQQHPDLAGIWTFNDTSATGVASAFGSGFAPVLVSINGQPEAIPLVEEGLIHTTFDLQQDMLGRALAYAAIAALCGEELPEDIWVESRIIDASNVADWVNPQVRGSEPLAVELREIDGRVFIVES